jgi:hypothetical protein
VRIVEPFRIAAGYCPVILRRFYSFPIEHTASAGRGFEIQMLGVPVLEKTPQGVALHIDDATHFVFCGEKPMRWLKRHCANGYHEPIMSQLLVEYLRTCPIVVFFDVGALFGYFGLLALPYQKAKQKSLNLK